MAPQMNLERSPMTLLPKYEDKADIPSQIFEKFLQSLQDAEMTVELVARLRKALIEEKTINERALKEAVLGEERLP